MDYLNMFLFFSSFGIFYLVNTACDVAKELMFPKRVENDKLREELGYVRKWYGWKRPSMKNYSH